MNFPTRLTMQKANEIAVVAAKAAPAAVKDTGRVQIGGGAIHFSDVTPGHASTKDTGRVKIGGGAVSF
jgi:hypothetical protein